VVPIGIDDLKKTSDAHEAYQRQVRMKLTNAKFEADQRQVQRQKIAEIKKLQI
jgi:hypothetical protein